MPAPPHSRLQIWRGGGALALLVASLLTTEPAQTASLVAGPNRNTTQSAGNNAETTIAINPLNPQNLFADDTWSTAGRFSTDGGATWQTSDLSALPSSIGDVSAAWDDFGNLFLTQFGGSRLRVVVGLSTNGGASFQLIFTSSGNQNDQPTVAVGPSSTPGQGSVWLSYMNSSSQLVAQGAAVTGLGQVGVFSAPQAVPGKNGDFGDIAIGPNGEVMVVYQHNNSGEGPDTLNINLDPDGLDSAGFGPTIAATDTQVGGFAVIPAQPIRSIDAEAGLAWDRSGGPHQGRVYLMYTDRPDSSSYDTDIYVRHSDDSGTSWSSPVRVNDDPVGNGKSQFLPKIALDQTTGYIAVSFYDCRNSLSNNTAELWASLSTDGGVSFLPNIKVSGGVSSALVSAISSTQFDYGDYTGLAFYGGSFYPCWADNSNSTGDNPAGALDNFDIYTAQVTLTNPVPAPTLLNPTLAGADFTFSFQSVTGATYMVQYRDDLADTTWGTLDTITGDGTVMVVTNSLALSPARFYRISVP